MKNLFQKKPWYFAFIALSFVVNPIIDWFVMYFFDEAVVREFLQKSILVSDIIPWCFGGIIFFVCTIVYIVQRNSPKRENISTDELISLKNVLHSAVDENEYIESMQAFQYRIKNEQSRKYIKLWHLVGIANEGIEINTILQTYFYFSYPLYKKIRMVSGRYDKYISETDPVRKDDFKTAFLDAGNDLCNQLLDTLNAIQSVDQIQEFHCDLYRVVAKLFPTVSNNAIESFLRRSDVESEIIKRKKTGILGALILNELYLFRNQTSLSKSDRVYFVFPYNTEKNIVFLGAISGSCFPSENPNSLEEYCKSVVTGLCGGNNS